MPKILGWQEPSIQLHHDGIALIGNKDRDDFLADFANSWTIGAVGTDDSVAAFDFAERGFADAVFSVERDFALGVGGVVGGGDIVVVVQHFGFAVGGDWDGGFCVLRCGGVAAGRVILTLCIAYDGILCFCSDHFGPNTEIRWMIEVLVVLCTHLPPGLGSSGFPEDDLKGH